MWLEFLKKLPLTLGQLSLLEPLKIDFAKIITIGNKDIRRIKMYFAATQEYTTAKAIELAVAVAQGDTAKADLVREQLIEFTGDTVELSTKWFEAAQNAPRKFSLASLFKGYDPFKEVREETRKHAAKWGLNTQFRDEMG